VGSLGSAHKSEPETQPSVTFMSHATKRYDMLRIIHHRGIVKGPLWLRQFLGLRHILMPRCEEILNPFDCHETNGPAVRKSNRSKVILRTKYGYQEREP